MKIQVTFEINEDKYQKYNGLENYEKFDTKEEFKELVYGKMDKPESGVKIVDGSFKEIEDEDHEDDEYKIYFSSRKEIPANVDDLLEYFKELSEEIHSGYGYSISDFIWFYNGYEEDLPDGGWTDTISVKRGSRTFELEIEFETEWSPELSDNIPWGYTILSVKETTIK